jgi:hypothetical protein
MTDNTRLSTLSFAVKLTIALILLGGMWSPCSVASTLATEIAPPEAPVTQLCGATVPNAGGETFCGTLNPHTRARAGYYFAYSAEAPCTAGAKTAAQELEGEDVAVFGAASNLEPNTAYVICLVAVNAGGETVGNEVSIVTPLAPPALLGLSANSISQHDAVLEVEINPYGLATTYEFRLESPPCPSTSPEPCGASGGSQIATGSLPAGHGQEKVSVDLADVGHPLTPATSYGYSVLAANAAGQTTSPRQAFVTLVEAMPPPFYEVPAGLPESATLPATPQPAETPKRGPTAASLGPLTATSEKRGTHRLTRREKLRKALSACGKVSRETRTPCRRHALERYGRLSSRPRPRLHEEFTFER